MAKGIIYVLADPRTAEVRYVGQTRNEKRRRWLHCSPTNNRGGRRVNVWIRSLLRLGLEPFMYVVEETDDPDAREMYWITVLRERGCPLLNMNDGGPTVEQLHRAPTAVKRGGKQRELHYLKRNVVRGIRWALENGKTELAERMRYALDVNEAATKRLARKLGSRSAANAAMNERLLEGRKKHAEEQASKEGAKGGKVASKP